MGQIKMIKNVNYSTFLFKTLENPNFFCKNDSKKGGGGRKMKNKKQQKMRKQKLLNKCGNRIQLSYCSHYLTSLLIVLFQ